jgi:hypothetical protein
MTFSMSLSKVCCNEIDIFFHMLAKAGFATGIVEYVCPG